MWNAPGKILHGQPYLSLKSVNDANCSSGYGGDTGPKLGAKNNDGSRNTTTYYSHLKGYRQPITLINSSYPFRHRTDCLINLIQSDFVPFLLNGPA